MKNGNAGKLNIKYLALNKKVCIKTISIFICTLIVSLTSILTLNQEKVNTLGKEQLPSIEDKDMYHDHAHEVEDKNVVEAKEEVDLINNAVSDIIGDNSEAYGVFYYDICSGVQYSVNADNEFHAASTIKVPIAMMIADKLTNSQITLNTEIVYEESDYETGAGILQGQIKEGQAIKVDELLENMIVESDNIATSMLKKKINSVPNYVSNLTDIKMEKENNIVTPRQMAIVLKELYNKSYENEYYKDVIRLMLRTSSNDRLDKYVPQNIVAHKIGDYEEYINDIGIVFTNKPYILCIYTKSAMEEGRENIAKISKVIYDIKTNTSN